MLSNLEVALIGLGPSLTGPCTGCGVTVISTVLVGAPGGCAVTSASSESRTPVQGSAAGRERKDEPFLRGWRAGPFEDGHPSSKTANGKKDTIYSFFLLIFPLLIIPKEPRGLS